MADTRTWRAVGWVAVGGVVVVAAFAAYWMLFSAFMLYDDEGYVLISLRNFATHGALYDQVYTQYGPFPYLLYDGLHRLLGFEFTNTSGRWITGVAWLGICGASTALVARATRSPLWSAFTFAGVFAYLWIMIAEPIHPGGLIALIVAVAAWLGAAAAAERRSRRLALVGGITAALLTLTKVNVGVFLLAPLAVWLALNTASSRAARVLTQLAVLSIALLPAALMHTLWTESWVRAYALLFLTGALTTLMAARESSAPLASARTWVLAGSVFGAGLLGIAAVTLVRGTTLHGLIAGVLLEPLRHPGVYSFPMNWRPGAAWLALASLGAATWTWRTRAWRRPGFVATIAWVRILVAIVFLTTATGLLPLTMPGWGMTYGPAIAWLFVVQLGPDSAAARGRAWVALLLVFQFLHAFPVAGSQLNWGTFLWVPLLALGVHDAVPVLRATAPILARWILGLGAAAVTVVSVLLPLQYAHLGWTRYSTSLPLGLEGARELRMPDELTYAMRIATQNLRAHGDLLFSAPGLYSANIWTGLPTPTLANATHWFSLLNADQQQAIIRRLAAADRPVVLVQRPVLDYVVQQGFAHRGPLQRYLRDNFAPAFSLYPYEIWVRRGRHIAALSTARVATNRTGSTLVLTLPPGTPAFDRIEVCDVTAAARTLATIELRDSATTREPIDLAGEPLKSAPPVPSACAARLTIPIRRETAALLNVRTLLRARGPAGKAVAEFRLIAPTAGQ